MYKPKIFTIILFLTTISNSNSSPLEQCTCMPDCSHPTPDIECPMGHPKLHVQAQSTQVNFDCENLHPNEYAMLPPNVSLGEGKTWINMKRCPLPLGTPLNGIFNRLSINHIKTLYFERANDEKMLRIHLKGLNDLVSLRLSGIDFSEMNDDIFADLKNLTRLDLRSNKIYSLGKTFAPLENLKSLELGNNKLQNLERGIFKNQKYLTHLNLWGNNLTNLSKSAFEGAESVTELDLSANNIATFQPDVFSLLKNLTVLNLSGNYILSLPIGLFSENTNLAEIRLNNNRLPLSELPAGLFSNLPKLKKIQMTSELKKIPANLFKGSKNLEDISFANNKIENLPVGLFDDQSNLLNVDFSNNKLTIIPDNLFINNTRLETLTLANNQITMIEGDAFVNLKNLRILKINNNLLTTLSSTLFKTIESLQEIYAQDNLLNFVPTTIPNNIEFNSPFNNLIQLQVLNLRNNSIIKIYPDWYTNLIQLRKLDLSYNQLTMLSYSDFQFSNKLSINLTNNKISEIDLREIELLTFNENNRVQIDYYLNNNPINCNCVLVKFILFIHQELSADVNALNKKYIMHFDNLQCAEPSNLMGKSIQSIKPKELLCKYSSQDQNGSRCPTNCNCWVRSYDDTFIINCSNAQLTKIPYLPRIKEMGLNSIILNVENNQIKKLPINTTIGYENIIELYANNNNISEIRPNNIPNSLRLLDLSKNHMQRINESTLVAMNKTQSLRTIFLSQNQWLCDCQAIDMISYVKGNYKIIHDFNDIKCENGDLMSKIDRVCNTNESLVIAASITIALLGIALGIVAALYYKYHQEIKVWLFAHKLCLWFVTEEELDRDKKYDAFISYSHQDEDFITEYLVPKLENDPNDPNPFKLCIHIRDWVAGEFIPDQIVKSVENSRRTIVVLSANFLESVWGRMEFRAAHTAAMNEGRARVIVIIYGEIGDVENLDPELKAYLKMNTYVKWGDPWFWDKLRYAMPHPQFQNNRGLIKNALKSSIDDKLELIKPISVTPPPLTTPPADQASKNPLLSKLNTSTQQIPQPKQNGILQQQIHQKQNGRLNGINGHINGAFIINTNAKQSDV